MALRPRCLETSDEQTPPRPPPWSDLQEDLLDEILPRLAGLPDLFRFGKVCSSWRSAALRRRRLCSPPPLLVASEPECESSSRNHAMKRGLFFLDANHSRFHRLKPIPDMKIPASTSTVRRLPRRRHVCASSMGWLVLSEETASSSLDIRLLNPVSGEQLRLPSGWAARPRKEKFGSMAVVWGALLSSPDPTAKDSVVVTTSFASVAGALTDAKLVSGSVLAVCRPGLDKEWKAFHYDGQDGFNPWSMAFHKGRLYCLARNGITKVFDMTPKPRLMARVAHPPRIAGCLYRNLVESQQGELLLVVGDTFAADDDRVEFSVYKLAEERGRWVRIPSLGNQVVLLGDFISESMASTDFMEASGFRANCIYYQRGNKSVHVYSMEDGSYSQIPIPFPGKDGAYWVKPRSW